MNSQIKIEVIDKEGWQKEFSFQKSLFHIGSAAVNDLVLENTRGGGVAARHAQLIASPDGTGFRLVNLGDTDILLNEAGDKTVPPHSVASVSDGSVVKVGDFTLIFHGEAMMIAAAPTDGRSSHIGLRLSLPRTQLAPHQSLAGVLAVGNHGDQRSVQFDLDLEGLEPDCYNIEPAPLLSSGSEREVALRIFHRGNKPLAGEHTLTIHAVAPDTYPDEEATVRYVIQVQPFYQHTLRPASTANVPISPIEDLLPPATPTRPTPRAAVAPPPTVVDQKSTVPLWEEPTVPAAKADTAPAMPEKQQILTMKAAPPPKVQAEPLKAAPTPSAAEDWWAVPEVKATPPAVVEAEAIKVPESPAPESAPEPAIAEAPVPLPEVQVELQGVGPTPSIAEDWWTGPEVPASPEVTVEAEPAAVPATVAPESGAVEAPTPPPTVVEPDITPEVQVTAPVDVWDVPTPETAVVVEETVVVVEEAPGEPETPVEKPEVMPVTPTIEEPWTAPAEEVIPTESPVEVEAPREQEPPPPVVEAGSPPATDDWWAVLETPSLEKEKPQMPVVIITPSTEAEPALPSGAEVEPTPQAEVKPTPQADDWWSEPEKKDTPPTANEDWWSA